MDPADAQRSVSVRIWLALLVFVGLYALLLVTSRSRTGASASPADPRNASIFWMLLFLGVVQLALLRWAAGRRLRFGPGTPFSRARVFFLLRALSAEVLALDGVMLGFLRRPIQEPLVFIAATLAGFALCFPSREAWAEAVRIAENPAS